MARKRRPNRQSKEEKTAQEYFPINKESIKRAIEKSYNKIERKDLETIENKNTKKTTKKKRKTTSNKTKKSKSKIESYKIPNIKLKSKGYELIITEKPQAASKIAAALGNAKQTTNKGVSYYELTRNERQIVVACAVGHLFTLKQTKSGLPMPVFDINWYPNYITNKKDFTKKYYATILKLVKGADEITVATDYDVEGELIGLNIVRFLCGQKDANRMKFSTLTNAELNQAYENKEKTINWGQAIAGETRHYLDWFYGINLSRALMEAIKTTGKFRLMSIGRVQGPALNLIVKKEKTIQAFKPETYWQVFINLKGHSKIDLKYNRDIFKKENLKLFDNLKGKIAEVKTEKQQQELSPNPPFDLTTLQTEAYKFYKITPARTLQAAQQLYLSGLISYPRTSSQKLPESIGYKEILKKMSKQYSVENLIVKDKPIEGKKSDPAHPSIYPTGEFQILSGESEKIYNLIARRFLSLFCENAIIENKKITANIENLKFSAKGAAVKKPAWTKIYPFKLVDKELEDINGKKEILKIKIEEKQTQPPRRYSPASILSELEKRNLGTKSTRSSILETLYDRDYIKEKSIEATPLGISLINTLEEYSPIIIDEKLTRNFEKEIENIQASKKNIPKKENKIIKNGKKTVTKIIQEFKQNEENIGKKLLVANEKLRNQQKEENTLNICPVCKKGQLAITYSRKTKRHFIACNAYPKCKTTYSLPPDSLIKKTDQICDECGFPKLISLRKGKRPWIFCFNPKCPTNKERIEEYKKRKEELI